MISAVLKHMSPMAGHDLSVHDEDGGSRMIKTETCKIDRCLPLSPGQEIPWVRQAEGHGPAEPWVLPALLGASINVQGVRNRPCNGIRVILPQAQTDLVETPSLASP